MSQELIQIKKVEKTQKSSFIAMKPLEISNASSGDTQEMKKMRLPRGKRYVQLMQQIDMLNEKDKELVSMLQSIPVNNKLLGILSECGIEGCIIHAIDKWGNIIAHFRNVEEIPEDLRDGYFVYLQNKSCISVEIYTYTICVIYDDGTVKFIERNE